MLKIFLDKICTFPTQLRENSIFFGTIISYFPIFSFNKLGVNKDPVISVEDLDFPVFMVIKLV